MALPHLIAALRHGEPTRPLSDAALISAAKAQLGPGPVAWVIATAAETRGLVLDVNPDVEDLPIGAIVRASETMLLDVVLELAGCCRPCPKLTSDQQDIVRYTVERALPFRRIVSTLRAVQQHWTQQLLSAGIGTHPDAVTQVVDVVVRYFDRVVDQVISEYLAESERSIESVAARRREIVANLLDGKQVDADVVRARLGIDLAGHHLAVVLCGPAGESTHDELRSIANTIAGTVKSDAMVLYDAGPGGLGVWLGNPRAPRSLAEAAPRLARVKVQLVAGSVQPGPGGFRRSHREALAATRVAAHTTEPLLSYPAVALSALLGSDMELATWFVRDHLGPLAGRDAAATELRATLAEFYRRNLSLVATAEPLHVHRNTVVYRLRRIEQLLGHPVTRHVPEVRSALLLVETYGDAVLSDER